VLGLRLRVNSTTEGASDVLKVIEGQGRGGEFRKTKDGVVRTVRPVTSIKGRKGDSR
jgi:hypothetical protein